MLPLRTSGPKYPKMDGLVMKKLCVRGEANAQHDLLKADASEISVTEKE